MPLTTTLSLPSVTCVVGTAVNSIIPVTASGGTAPLSFSINTSLPPGLSFSTSTGAITGTPLYINPITFYTVTVTDSLNATSSKTFNLTVVTPVILSSTLLLARKSVNTNFDVGSFTPVIASGGYGTVTYSINPALPTGLSINPSTGEITGIPTVSTEEISYAVTVTDEARSGVTKRFYLTSIRSALTATTAVSYFESSITNTISALTPVVKEGGEGAISYSISPALPSGVTLNSSTGVISGNPTIGLETRTFYITVTDRVAQSSTSSFVMYLPDPDALVVTSVISNKNLIKNVGIIPFTPVTTTNGHGAPVFSISPALPSGIILNENTGEITGKPTVFSNPTLYSIRVLDVNGQDFYRDLTLRVLNPVTLTANVVVPEVTLYVNYSTANVTPVQGAGGYGTYSYSISPGLPEGLSFNNGLITGTVSSRYHQTYNVTITDQSEQITTASFILSVVDVPLIVTTEIPEINLNQWYPLVSPIFPTSISYGLRPVQYAITPALPNGLTLNSSDGSISGTPYEAVSTSTYTIIARDSVTTSTSSFNLNISAVSPSTGSNWITPSGFIGTLTELLYTSTVVTFAESSATFTIISGELPAGLSLSSNGIIYGTPNAVIK